MAGGLVLDANRRKIKGRRLTVCKFFLISVAYTIGWYTISSELDYFRDAYGPQILLQLNIAYYLPSIPLLVISSHFDEALETKYGVVRLVLARLLIGLTGCAAVVACFPLAFHMETMSQAHLYILGSTVLLGLFTGTAFSASYQLVSRFANKNVISLGLGFAGGGLVTLLVQLGLRIGHHRTWAKELAMYETVAGITVAGLFAALSIVVRKGGEIEEIAAEERRHLKQHSTGGGEAAPQAAAAAAVQEDGDQGQAAEDGEEEVEADGGECGGFPKRPPVQRSSYSDSSVVVPLPLASSGRAHSGGSLIGNPRRSIGHRLPGLVAYDCLDPYCSVGAMFSTGEEGEGAGSDDEGGGFGWQPGSLPMHFGGGGGLLRRLRRSLGEAPLTEPLLGGGHRRQQRRASGSFGSIAEGWDSSSPSAGGADTSRLGVPARNVLAVAGDGALAQDQWTHGAGGADGGIPGKGGSPTSPAKPAAEAGGGGYEDGGGSGSDGAGGDGGGQSCDSSSGPQPGQLREVLAATWPVLTAYYLAGVTILMVFPFFTYIQSSGTFETTLHKVLFFIRLFADITGRMLPRVAPVTSPALILGMALALFGTVPGYFAYLKASPSYRCDTGIIVYIVALWLLCGYVNTCANITAPRLVKPHLKSGAAGIMAVTFQVSHFSGLLLAVVVSFVLFGGITGHHQNWHVNRSATYQACCWQRWCPLCCLEASPAITSQGHHQVCHLPGLLLLVVMSFVLL